MREEKGREGSSENIYHDSCDDTNLDWYRNCNRVRNSKTFGSVIMDSEIKGMCMTCGLVFKGATRAMVDGQFTLHINERHIRKLNAMQTLRLTFFTDKPPKLERKKAAKKPPKKKGWTSSSFAEKERKAMWV